MKVSLFLKNAVVVGLTSFVLRLAGMFFRVYIAGKIGAQGMGLYQLIFSVYVFASTFATSGISTAVTRLVAENMKNGREAVKKIMRTAVFITLAVAIVSVAVIFFGANPISVYLLKDIRAELPLKILSISLPFMGLSSCARGYFFARRKQLPPSLVQLFEQAIRIISVYVLLSRYASKGIEFCTSAILFGDTVAEIIAFAVIWMWYIRDINKLTHGKTCYKAIHQIMRIATPISCGGYLSSALHTAESLLVPLRLTLFYATRERSLELFGAIKGMALPVLFFPASFLTALSTMLLPEISYAVANKDKIKIRQTVSRSTSTTLTISVFIAIAFMFNSNDIGKVVYNDSDVGKIIAILSPIIPFMYFESVASGLLKGLDGQMNMFKYNLVDSCLRIAAVFLVLPYFGIKGYLFIMIVSNCFTSTLCSLNLFKASEVKIDFANWIVKPLVISVLGGLTGHFISKEITHMISRLIISIAIQTLVFGFWYKKSVTSKKAVTQKILKA